MLECWLQFPRMCVSQISFVIWYICYEFGSWLLLLLHQSCCVVAFYCVIEFTLFSLNLCISKWFIVVSFGFCFVCLQLKFIYLVDFVYEFLRHIHFFFFGVCASSFYFLIDPLYVRSVGTSTFFHALRHFSQALRLIFSYALPHLYLALSIDFV